MQAQMEKLAIPFWEKEKEEKATLSEEFNGLNMF